MSKVEQRLSELGLTLPEVATPAGSYLPAMISGNRVFTAGQIPLVEGKLMATGKLGAEIWVRICGRFYYLIAGLLFLVPLLINEPAVTLIRRGHTGDSINALAAVKSVIGDLDRVKQIVKIVGFVSSVPEFTAQPSVINGASEFLQQVFGDAGQHARSAVGVSVLPLDAPVEIELIVEFS